MEFDQLASFKNCPGSHVARNKTEKQNEISDRIYIQDLRDSSRRLVLDYLEYKIYRAVLDSYDLFWPQDSAVPSDHTHTSRFPTLELALLPPTPLKHLFRQPRLVVWIFKVLSTRAFRDGTHYYPSPDLFLYYVSRLLRKAPELRARFGPLPRECVMERMQADGDTLALSARLIAAVTYAVKNDSNMAKLLALQRGDGSWDKGVVYHFTRVEGMAWHQVLTVILAVLAIEKSDFLRRR